MFVMKNISWRSELDIKATRWYNTICHQETHSVKWKRNPISPVYFSFEYKSKAGFALFFASCFAHSKLETWKWFWASYPRHLLGGETQTNCGLLGCDKENFEFPDNTSIKYEKTVTQSYVILLSLSEVIRENLTHSVFKLLLSGAKRIN